MASSSTAPVGPPLQPGSGEELEVPPLVPAASTEAMVDVPMPPPPIPGESVPTAPSSVSGEAEESTGRATPINFDFLYAASKDWSHWVDREILDSDFWDNLVDAEVHWSILISRSCNMFRDTEALRELEYSLSNIKLSAAEEEIAAVLKKHSSTRLSGWPSTFINHKKAPIRRAAFILYWLCHLYSQLNLLHDCEIAGDSCYILSTAFNTSALQTFFWEHSISYIYAARDRSAAWGRFSDLPQKFLNQFPSFRDNLPLVYRWVGLKPRDHDLVDALDYEENVLFRPYGDDHPGFTCASIFRKLYGPSPLIRDLKVDDYQSLSYLSTVNPGFLPILSATSVAFIPYCPQRVQRQFGLDQGIPIGPQETTSCVADLTAFLKSSAFARWGGETTRVLIPGGHRFGFNTPSMGAYWQRLTQSMVDYVIAGRSDQTPINLGLQSGIVSEEVGLPIPFICLDGWRSSVSVVEDRLIMPSKRGKGSKRDAPADPVFEKTPKKSAPTASSSKKAPSKKAKAVKQGKSPPMVSSAAEESTTAFVQGSTKSARSPPGLPWKNPLSPPGGPSKKTKVGKKSKSTASVPLAAKESIAAPVKESVESTVAPSKPKSASPAKQTVEKSAASGPPRGQKKASISSSTDEEEPSAVSTPSPPKKKKFTAPLFPLGAAGRTRSKSGPRVARGSGGSGGDMVVVEVISSSFLFPRRRMLLRAAAVDQTEDLGKSAADSPGIGVESTGEDHSSSSGSFFDSVPDSVPEEQIGVCGVHRRMMTCLKMTIQVWGAADSVEEDLAIVPHVSQGCDDDSTVDADVDPISFSVPQTVLNQQNYRGFLSLVLAPSLRAVPAGGFVISASHLTNETPPFVGGALMLEGPHAQGLVESEPVVDLVIDAADHDVPAGDTNASAADTLAGSDHLEEHSFLSHGLGCCPMEDSWPHGLGCRLMKGVDDAVHVSEEIDEVGITGEVTVVSPPRRPTIEAGSSVGVGGLSGEVAAFLREFDARAPNPHPEQFFWSFNGPLVPFGDFWVPNDCSPYLSRLSAGHSDFTKGFKLSIGLGGPMMSLLGSVLAAMDESSLEDVTKTQILAWRSVIQDLMDVGFDLGFMMERLRQMAQRLFGKRLADEIKALQHQIALLQDSLAELTAYQDAMMSTGGVVPRSERGGSFLDSLLD
uniref:Aminotransferase-like plant mobile domain-containing protein n=1 Tax=Fagus sylvatica TaxID=28930 RepID=A0A2N9HQV0_FAGSY